MTVRDSTWYLKGAPWLESLIHEVCEAEQVPIPDKVTFWSATPARASTTGMHRSAPVGQTKWSYLSLTVGTDVTNARVVALHELAHHIVYERLGAHDSHSDRFWEVAWKLYQRYDLVDPALVTEGKYKVAATEVAERMGIASSDGRAASSFRRQPVAAAASTLPPWSVPYEGEVAETFGMREKWNGLRVVVVKHRDTRSLVRLMTAADRYPAGAEVLVPKRCLRSTGTHAVRKMRVVTVELSVEYFEGEDWHQKLPAGAKVVSATVEYDR